MSRARLIQFGLFLAGFAAGAAALALAPARTEIPALRNGGASTGGLAELDGGRSQLLPVFADRDPSPRATCFRRAHVLYCGL